ncbi:MAG: hypothetical protein LH702_04965 [Phormidesmis sp. CAN_BIN44]|nr:hypothetical protein [Phormidesmis sp. CAN_BIN44]
MNTSAKLLTAALAITASVSIPRIAVAQNCNYYAGQASNGQTINVDLCSTRRVSDRSVDFVYFLGSERIYSQANVRQEPGQCFLRRPSIVRSLKQLRQC